MRLDDVDFVGHFEAVLRLQQLRLPEPLLPWRLPDQPPETEAAPREARALPHQTEAGVDELILTSYSVHGAHLNLGPNLVHTVCLWSE